MQEQAQMKRTESAGSKHERCILSADGGEEVGLRIHVKARAACDLHRRKGLTTTLRNGPSELPAGVLLEQLATSCKAQKAAFFFLSICR